jgi:hypothetical protein
LTVSWRLQNPKKEERYTYLFFSVALLNFFFGLFTIFKLGPILENTSPLKIGVPEFSFQNDEKEKITFNFSSIIQSKRREVINLIYSFNI